MTDDGAVISTPPHSTDAAAVAAAFRVVPADGLANDEAARRLAASGANELAERTAPPLWRMVWDAATEPFILLLLGAGALAVVLGEVRDGLLVMIGLLPIVPADLRLLETDALLVDRSALTGESLPEAGSVAADPADSPLADRRSMAYAGTSVVGGRGLGLVVTTGQTTEIGRIAGGLAVVGRRRSPLQRELDRLVRILLVAAVALITITVGLGFLRGQPAGANLLAGISAAIAAIPEEPPVLPAVILGLGAYRLLRKGVLVRRLNAQETLGAVDLILTDKTGTLTENRLAVARVVTPAGPMEPQLANPLLLEAFRAEDDAWHVAAGGVAGPFARAISEAIDGPPPILDPAALLGCEAPSDATPYSLTRTAGEELALGAPEAVLRLCGSEPPAWHEAIARETDEGGRLLLLARRTSGATWEPRAILVFADQLRADVGEAMAVARGAGIQTIVVTGDHPRRGPRDGPRRDRHRARRLG